MELENVSKIFELDKNEILPKVKEKIIDSLNYKILTKLEGEKELAKVTPIKIKYVGNGHYLLCFPETREEMEENLIQIIFPDAMEEFDDLYKEICKVKEHFPNKVFDIDYSIPYTEIISKVIREDDTQI